MYVCARTKIFGNFANWKYSQWKHDISDTIQFFVKADMIHENF